MSREQNLWGYVAESCTYYMSKRDRLSAEERWEEAAHIATSATRIATSLTHMGTVETLVSTAAVCGSSLTSVRSFRTLGTPAIRARSRIPRCTGSQVSGLCASWRVGVGVASVLPPFEEDRLRSHAVDLDIELARRLNGLSSQVGAGGLCSRRSGLLPVRPSRRRHVRPKARGDRDCDRSAR